MYHVSRTDWFTVGLIHVYTDGENRVHNSVVSNQSIRSELVSGFFVYSWFCGNM